jgi:hypothetical protein
VEHDLNALAALADGRLTAEERRRCMAHLAACVECRETLASFTRASAPVDAPSAMSALRSGTGLVRALIGAPRWMYAAAAGVALAVLIPMLVSTPTPDEGAVRAGIEGAIADLSPTGTISGGPPDSFRWSAPPGDGLYRVRVFSGDGVPLWTSLDVSDTVVAWPPDLSLPPGTYSWWVEVRRDGAVSRSPLTSFTIAP